MYLDRRHRTAIERTRYSPRYAVDAQDFGCSSVSDKVNKSEVSRLLLREYSSSEL